MSENNHPINEVLQTTMGKIKEMVDANTIVGQPIVTQDGVTLIPVSQLSFGFASGGSDFGKTQGVAKNFSITPVSFLVVKDGSVRVLPVMPPPPGTLGRVVDLVPDMFDKVTGYIDRKTGDPAVSPTPMEEETE